MNASGLDRLRWALLNNQHAYFVLISPPFDEDPPRDIPFPEIVQDQDQSIFMSIKILEARWKKIAELRKITTAAASEETKAWALEQIEVIKALIKEGLIRTDNKVTRPFRP